VAQRVQFLGGPGGERRTGNASVEGPSATDQTPDFDMGTSDVPF